MKIISNLLIPFQFFLKNPKIAGLVLLSASAAAYVFTNIESWLTFLFHR